MHKCLPTQEVLSLLAAWYCATYGQLRRRTARDTCTSGKHRWPNMAMLTPGGCCADCVADMGLRRPDEHSVWLGRVKEETGPSTWQSPRLTQLSRGFVVFA
ncbi:hypothetical protein GCM10010464_00030 [Pseudonocardia yunnanensis]|uniref:Secreted protein n=1 Tax=Pseudonocardia yunnanensis TaxID=58107 RepID=A0ABW4F9P4_9PSEU